MTEVWKPKESREGNESREGYKNKPLFKITLMRHAKPFYKDEGHDLTPEGVEQAIVAGKKMKEENRFEDSDVFLFHSPKPRAKGTLDFAAEAAGLGDKERRIANQLRASDIHDYEAFMTSVTALGEAEGIDSAEASTKHHYVDPMHKEGVIIEKHAKKQERLYRTLEQVIRWFEQHPYEGAKTPHLLIVSHFELLTHLIHDVFGIESFDKYNVPAFAELIGIAAYPESKGKTHLVVSYGGRVKDAIFNRQTRSIEVLSES